MRLINADDIYYMKDIASGDRFVYKTSITAMETIKAIPIPKKATNGDMIKSTFPYCKIEYLGDLVKVLNIDNDIVFSLTWWNSPYKRRKR